MKTLQQNTEYKTIGLGWFGLCHEEDGYICEDFELSTTNEQVQKIDHVYEVSGEDSSRPVFFSTYANHVHEGVENSLTHLKCGRAYYVVLKKGEGELDIPGFFFTDSKTTEKYNLTDECYVAPTPTATPTPSPSPSQTPTFTFAPGEAPVLNITGNKVISYTEYTTPSDSEITLAVSDQNVDTITLEVSETNKEFWTYNNQPITNSGNYTITNGNHVFKLNENLLAAENSDKNYNLTLKFTATASEDETSGVKYQDVVKNITLQGKVFDRKVIVGHNFTINADSKLNTFSVAGTINHTRCPNSLYKWTTQKTADSDEITIIEDFGVTELTGGGNKNVSFDLDLETEEHLAFFTSVSDNITSEKFKAYFTLSAYGIHQTVRDTNYETYQGSNQTYSIEGQVTPIDSFMDDGGYEVFHPDFFIQGEANTGTRANKIYTLNQSVTMAPGVSTSASPSGGVRAVLVRHWVKEAKLVSVTAQDSSHGDSLDAWEMTNLSDVPDVDASSASLSWLPASSDSNANKNVMDVANFDFRLKSGLTEANNYNIKATFEGTTIKDHDITITLNLNGEVIATPGPLVINDLWISFAKVDPVAWFFSDFLEVRGAEAENVTSYDVNGDVAEFNKYNDDIIQNNTKFDKTKHIDSDGYNPFSSTKNGFIEEYFSTYEEMIDAFHDTVVFRVEGEDREAKFVIDFVAEFDYTKFKIIDENFTEEGFTFDKTISHAFLVKSSTKPSASDGSTPNDIFETSFNADGEISLKCGDTWNYDANPKTNLIFLGNKEHKFTDVWSTESLATQSGLTNKDDDNKTPWLGGKMSLSANASNTIDSVLGTNNVFSIKEFYFQKVGQDSPIKFGDGNPKGSHCSDS